MREIESPVVETWPIASVLPFPDNPRTISDTAVTKLADVIRAFGWRQPIVVDEEGVILAGHTRLRAAEALGLAEVPVHVARGLSADEAAAYRLADNRTGEETTWNLGALATSLSTLQARGFNMKLTAFNPAELPDFKPPSFEPIAARDVKPLDKRAPIRCPACGEEFQP